MLEFRKKYFLHINYYINLFCNYNCEYCYIKHAFKPKLSKPFDMIKKELTIISKLFKDKKIFISLIGGEPTIHTEIDKIIDFVENNNLKNLDFHIYTNGTNIDVLKERKSLKITLTTHFPLTTQVRDNVFNIIDNNFNLNNFDITIPYYIKEKNNIDNFIKKLKERNYNNFAITPIHDLYDHNYIDQYSKYFKKLNGFDKINKKNKLCWYNEIHILFKKTNNIDDINTYITHDICYLKNIKINNIYELRKLKNIKKPFKCNLVCPKDYSFFGSVE